MESLEVLTSGEQLSPESSENIEEFVPESDAASESDVVSESDVASESDAASQEEAALASDQAGADPAAADLEPIVLVLEDIHTEVVTLNEALTTCNGLLLALLFFTVAQWVVSKIKGSVERMLNWKI